MLRLSQWQPIIAQPGVGGKLTLQLVRFPSSDQFHCTPCQLVSVWLLVTCGKHHSNGEKKLRPGYLYLICMA
jgi:hypothetical protein